MALPTNWQDDIGMEVDADYLNELGGDVNANTNARVRTGPYASRPGAASDNNGALYFTTDTDTLYLSNGTSWDLIRVGVYGGDLAELPSSGWTALTSSTVTADKGDRVITSTATGNNIRGEYRTLSPASNYTATALIEFTENAAYMSGLHAGMLLRDSAGKLIIFGLGHAGSLAIDITSATNETGAGIAAIATQTISAANIPRWFRIVDNGTNRAYQYSYNGRDWITVYTAARTTFMTPNGIGIGTFAANSNSITVRERSLKVA